MTVNDTLLLMIDFQSKLMPAMNRCDEIEKNVLALLKGCQVLEMPFLVTQQYTKGLGPTIPILAETIPVDAVFEKTTFSCMKNEVFQAAVKKLERSNVIVAGIESHICVQQTVMDLLDLGYNVYVAADCTGTRKQYDHQVALSTMQQNGARITTVEAILFELLVSADNPSRKEIRKIIK